MKLFKGNRNGVQFIGFHPLQYPLGKHPSFFDNDFSGIGVHHILACPMTFQNFFIKRFKIAVGLHNDFFRFIEIRQQVFRRIAKGLEKQCDRKFSATVNPDIHDILRVNFHIDPGSTNRNNTRGVNHLAAGMGFSFVMGEKYAGGPMQLADHNPLGTIDDKSPFFRHQRDGSEINFLFLDIPYIG